MPDRKLELSHIMQDLAAEHKVIILPSFSLFQNGELVEHYTGLESCKILEDRLKSSHSLPDMLASDSAEDSQGNSASLHQHITFFPACPFPARQMEE